MAKKWPKMAKNSVSLCISGTVPHMTVVFFFWGGEGERAESDL